MTIRYAVVLNLLSRHNGHSYHGHQIDFDFYNITVQDVQYSTV